jgi:hypothetical protein
MDLDFDHPVLLIQLLIFHEGYHHGQIKLALKAAGRPVTDDEARPGAWDVWMIGSSHGKTISEPDRGVLRAALGGGSTWFRA